MSDEIDWSKKTLQSPILNFYKPPQPNWSIHFGDGTDIHLQFYIKNPPNRFQRWMIKKVLGIKWKPVVES